MNKAEQAQKSSLWVYNNLNHLIYALRLIALRGEGNAKNIARNALEDAGIGEEYPDEIQNRR